MTADLAIAQLLLSTFLGAVTLIWGIFRYRRSRQRRRGAFKLQAYLLWILSALIGLSSFMPLTYLYTEHLWFESLGHSDVFWGLQQIQWGIFAVCFLGALGFMSMNAAIANVLCPESSEFRRWTAYADLLFPSISVLSDTGRRTPARHADAPLRRRVPPVPAPTERGGQFRRPARSGKPHLPWEMGTRSENRRGY